MNSRDVIDEPEITHNFLENIFSLQKNLLVNYQNIEGLPSYPVDVNTKSSQVLLKDFTSRIIEELAEGYEAHVDVVNSTIANNYWGSVYHSEQYNAMINDLQNVGEEQSDALHFFMELLIYANILPEDLNSYVDSKYPGRYTLYNGELLLKLQKVGVDLMGNIYPELSFINPMNDIDVLNSNNIPIENEAVLKDKRYFLCGSKINLEMLPYYKQMLWDITYHLNISRNFLKNKPWKQSEVMTQEIKYQEELVIAFLLFLGYLYHMNCTPEQIYFLYFKKNKINLFRILSKY